MEGMLERIPYKAKCKFDGCDFKRSDVEAVKKHEEGCEKRYVPCAYCDDKIGQKELVEHVLNKHYNGRPIQKSNLLFYWNKKDTSRKLQTVVEHEEGHFVMNRCPLDEVSNLFWISFIGPKNLASSFKYTMHVQKNKTEKKNYAFEATRDCIPCDMSHEDVKKGRCALMLENGLIDAVSKEDGKVYYWVEICKA